MSPNNKTSQVSNANQSAVTLQNDEAVRCINELAALGNTKCTVGTSGTTLRRCGSTEIWGLSALPPSVSTTVTSPWYVLS